MTVFDYVFLAIVALSSLVGLWRGLVSEVIAIAAWIVAFVAAWMYASSFSGMLESVVLDPGWRHVSAFALIFVGVLLLAAVFRFLLRELLKAVGLGAVDRFFGMLFGLVRGLAIAFVLVLIGGLAGMASEPWWRGALFAGPLETLVLASKPWLPEVVADKIRF